MADREFSTPAVLADEAAAYRYLEQLRWPGGPKRCPHCAVPGRCYYLRPRDGASRATRTGAPTVRRIWKCGACRRQFSVLTGSVLEGTRVDLLTWVVVLADVSGRRAGPTLPVAADLADRFGISRETARRMLQRLRAVLALEVAVGSLPAGPNPGFAAGV